MNTLLRERGQSPATEDNGLAPGVIQFPLGLLGFESVKKYRLQKTPDLGPLLWLQMLEGKKHSFLVIEPGTVLSNYSPEISKEDVAFVGLEEPSDALVLNIVTQKQDEATINLRGPLIVNRRTMVAKQVIPVNAANYEINHRLSGPNRPPEKPVSTIAPSAPATNGVTKPKLGGTAYSCALDNSPIFVAQCYIWLNCLLDIQHVQPESVFVHHPDIDNAEFIAWMKSRRVNVLKIKPFDSRSPHCNKIQQLKTFVNTTYDRVVLMDCDTALVGNAPLPSQGVVAGKIVDLANPPEAVLSAIFKASGLGEPNWAPASFQKGPTPQRTDHNNLNGGLYVIAASLIPRLDTAWRRWADWCLDHKDLFGEFAIHIDQVSFALALRELGVVADALPIEWNYPVHLPAEDLPDITPQMIHYHRRIGRHFKIEPVGLAKPDQAIEVLNGHIENFFSRHFINSIFWDVRYQVDPSLGSGAGSRGDCLVAKQEWLKTALSSFGAKAVVDVGCGDLETTRALPLANYLGLDVSREALNLARAKRPDWRFSHLSSSDSAIPEGDAVICLDVLIHQKSATEFNSLIRRLAQAAREKLIVSGYNEPQSSAGICFFHQSIAVALKETGLFSEIREIGQYRGLSLIVADKRRAVPAAQSTDIASVDLTEASRTSRRPEILRQLVDMSRETFGFFTSHFPRTIEYPWVAEKLENHCKNRRFLDIGAGLNPLPLFFVRRGAKVETIDSHPLVRVPPSKPDWSEWGFYDYAPLDANLRSHHLSVIAFEPESPMDVIYSVSVIEHMPRVVWEATLARCRRWLAKNGRLVLTIDVVPGTEWLWNYSEGEVVEPVEQHGSVTDFVRCLCGLGFIPREIFIQRQVPKSKTDLLFIDCIAG